MKWRKALGAAVKVAGPILGGAAVGGPTGGALAVAGQIAGALAKSDGAARAESGGVAHHQATAPAAAVAVPTLLAALLGLAGLPGVELSALLCGDGAQAGALLGVIAAFSHQLGHGIEKAGK